jgi:hypothetical protein
VITWCATVEYDSPDPVYAPTALMLALPGLSYRHTAADRLELVFFVEALTLRAAAETALRLARSATQRADVTGAARSVHVAVDELAA